jgi:hypothetical protein
MSNRHARQSLEVSVGLIWLFFATHAALETLDAKKSRKVCAR